MGSDKSNNKGNPPAATSPMQEHNEFAFAVSRNEAADCSGIFHCVNNAQPDLMSFPYVSLPVAPPWENMPATYPSCTHGSPETDSNLTADFMRFNSLQNPQMDPYSMTIGSSIPRIHRLSEISVPEWNTRGIRQSVTHDRMVTADNVMNGISGFGSFQNPQMNRNIMLPRGNAGGGYQMTRQSGEAKNSDINSPQINRNFINLGGSSTMIYHTQNSGDIEIDNNVKASAVQFGCSDKNDGSFLSLGIGGNAEAILKSTFSSQEISRKLEEAVSPKLNTSHFRQTTRSSSSLGHNLASGFPSFQSNAGGFSSTACNMGGWTSSRNDVGVIRGVNTGQSSSPFHILQAPQVDKQQDISMPGNRNSGFVSTRDARYVDLDPYKGFRGDQAAYSGAVSSSSAGFLNPRQMGLPGLASESANGTWLNTQTTSDQLQKYYIKTAKNFSSESSMNSAFIGLRGSSIRQDRSGQLLPALESSATQAAESSQFPRRMCAQPRQIVSARDGSAAGPSLFPKRTGVPVTEGTAAQTARGGLFPRRLGVQVNEGGAAQAAERDLFPKEMGVQTAGKLYRPQHSGSIQFPNNLHGPPFAIGRPEDGVPVQCCMDFRQPSSTTGQSQNCVPVQFSKDLWRPVSTAGQVIPAAKVNVLSQSSDVLRRPSLKRSEIRPPPAAPWVQRRKITPQPPIHPSMPFLPQTAPAVLTIPAIAPRKKWQGSDRPPKPTGQKCLLCKRDLSFAPEGPVNQPTVPPAVAVLPCGHTFHDHCLQIITPENQSKNPPCIPCAIGES